MRTYFDSYVNARYPARVLIWCLTILALSGAASPYSYNILPADLILEVALLISTISIFTPPKSSQLKFIIISILYISISFGIMMVCRPANTLDFAQAYKAFYYIIPLAFFVGRNIFRERDISTLLNITLALFLLKYGYSRLFNLTERLGERPGVFVENNFELIFLLILFYIQEPRLSQTDKILKTLLLIVIIFISGSRSALAALIVLFTFTYVKKIDGKTIFSLLLSGLLAVGAISVFISRMDGSAETIDRFHFLTIFLDETVNWEWYNYAMGSLPLTPLSGYSCKALSAYNELYSYSGDDTCYSVILHSFLLRVIFDHGILGLLFIIAFVLQSLSKSGYTRRQRACIILIILMSAFSVSAFNSVFTSLALAITLSYPQKLKRHL